MVVEQLDMHRPKKIGLDTDLTHGTKIKSKWIINLNAKHDTKKLIEDNTGENQGNLGFGNDFLDIKS